MVVSATKFFWKVITSEICFPLSNVLKIGNPVPTEFRPSAPTCWNMIYHYFTASFHTHSRKRLEMGTLILQLLQLCILQDISVQRAWPLTLRYCIRMEELWECHGFNRIPWTLTMSLFKKKKKSLAYMEKENWTWTSGWEVTNASHSFPCKIVGAYLLDCRRNRSLPLRDGCEPWIINERGCFPWSHIHSSKSWDIKASVDTVSVHSAGWIRALQYHVLRSL